MFCWKHDCPYYNFENGPFNPPTDEEMKTIAEKYDCDDIRIRICSTTTLDGVVHDEKALREQYKRECTIMEGVEAYE